MRLVKAIRYAFKYTSMIERMAHRQYEEAIALYEAIENLQPDGWRHHFLAAECYSRVGDRDNCVKTGSRAIEQICNSGCGADEKCWLFIYMHKTTGIRHRLIDAFF